MSGGKGHFFVGRKESVSYQTIIKSVVSAAEYGIFNDKNNKSSNNQHELQYI